MAERSILFDLKLDATNLQKNSKEAQAELQRLTALKKDIIEQHGKESVEYAKLQNQIRTANKTLKDNASALEIQERLNEKQNLSLAEMREALKAGSIAYAGLTEEQRNSEEVGGELQRQNLALKTSINELQEAQGNHTGSVGDYEKATRNLKLRLEEQNATLIVQKTEYKENTKALEELEKQGKRNSDEFKKLSQSQESLKESINTTSTEIKELTEEQKRLADEQSKTSKGMADMTNAMGNVPGVVGQSTNAIKSMSASLKALLLNPVVLVITAIVGVLALLTKAFTRSEEGQNSMAKAMAVLDSIFESFMDLLTPIADILANAFIEPQKAIKDFGKLLVDSIMTRLQGLLELIPALGKSIMLLFSGDFAEAGKVAFDAVAKVTVGVEDATEKMGKMSEQMAKNAKLRAEASDLIAKAEKIERELIVERSMADRKRADLREKAEQKDKFTREERLAFLKEASKIDEDITAKEIENARLKLQAIRLINDASISDAEAKRKEAEALAVLNNLETQRLNNQKRLTSQMQGLIKEEKAERDALRKSQEALNNSLIDTILANEVRTNEIQLKIIEERYKALFRIAKNNTDELIELEKQKNTELLALDEEVKKDAIESLEEKLKRELEANKKSVKIQEQLKKAFELDKQKIELEFEAKKIDRENALIDREKEHNRNRLENERKATNDLALINAELNLKNAKGLENEQEMFKAFQDEKIRIIRENALREIELNNLVGVEADKVRAKALLDEANVKDAKFELKEEEVQEGLTAEQQKLQQQTTMALTSANQLSGAMFQVVQNRLTKELNAVTDRYDEEAVKLQKQLDEGLISETEYLTAKNNIDDKFRKDSAKIKQEQFKRQKQADLTQSIINTLVATTQALPNIPLSVLAGAMGALQTGLIASQPIPKFAKGGVFGGKSHSNGGTKGTFEDGTQIEVEKDEAFFVLNRNATKQIGLLDRINRSTGGVPLMQNGGRVQFESGISAINTANQIDARNNSNNDIMNAISKLPRPVVAVQDINEAQGNLTNIVDFASF